MSKVLLKGNETIALAAIKGGCEAFFGYPITPQNEIPEYLSRYMKEHNRVFLQAESEIAAINMVYGASGAGVRVMTSSSSPGIALKQEGISYLCGANLPCVIVNVMRGGPGLGGIQPSQADYYQITRGGGNGDYRVISYAPYNLQELYELVQMAFDVADYYRNPVMVALDGLLGQMMEPVDLDVEIKNRPLQNKEEWATTGCNPTNKRRIINSLYLDPQKLEEHNQHLIKKYQEITENEQMYETYFLDDSEMIIVAYGTMARIALSAISLLNEEGYKIGLIRPITLWPYPTNAFINLPPTSKHILCAELSAGQMIDDVKLAVNGRIPVHFFGRQGGMLPDPEEIANAIKNIMEGK